jgi:GH25 family lysozyme M1 (1,4-beta-N-acetylmuramidase)
MEIQNLKGGRHNKWKKIKNAIGLLVLAFGLLFSFACSAFASSPKVNFIDVSHYNNEGGLPLSFYETIKASGVKGVVVKVSEDLYNVDPAAAVNIANVKQSGLVVSAYHYARFKSDAAAKAEADWFDKKLELVGFDKKKDGYVVADVEAVNLASSAALNGIYQYIYK